MNEKDMKLFKYRHRCTVIYGWLFLPAIILSIGAVLFLIGFYVVAPIEGTEYVEWAPIALWIYIGVTVIVDIVAYIYWKHLLNQGADSHYVEPYIVELNFSSKENLYSQIDNCIDLTPMFENVMYGYKKGRRNIRLFIIEMPEYNEQEYENIDDKMVSNAIENYGMKTELNRQEMYKAIRLNILLLEKFNDEAYKSAKKNALDGTQYAEAVIDVIADIEKKKLYIPAYWGTWYGGSATYRYCIKQLLGWLAN